MQNAQLQVEQGFFGREFSEKELIAHAAQGNENAFEAIMRRHNRRLFRTARSILGNDADAEEALQEAYLSAWKALDGFRSEAKLSTWLVRVVVNEALGRLRRKRLTTIPLDTVMNSHDPDLLRVSLTRDIDITLDDAFSFDGERCDRIVKNVLAGRAS